MSAQAAHVLNHPLIRAVMARGGRKSVMSGLYGFAAALQLCTQRVVAYGFSTRSSAPPEVIASIPRWAGGKTKGPRMSIWAVEALLTPPFPYHCAWP